MSDIRSLLILDDLVGYVGTNKKFTKGYVNVSRDRLGTRTREQLNRQEIKVVRDALIAKLTGGNKARYEGYSGKLDQPESSADLDRALIECNSESNLDHQQKEIIREVLILDDLLDYANASIYGGDNRISVSPAVRDRITGGASVLAGQNKIVLADIDKAREELITQLSASERALLETLRGRLNKGEGKEDLKSVLCGANLRRESFCPALLAATPSSVEPGVQDQPFTLIGVNLPKSATVELLDDQNQTIANGVVINSYQNQSETSATVRLNIPAAKMLADRSIRSFTVRLTSQDQLFSALRSGIIQVTQSTVLPPTIQTCQSPNVCLVPPPPIGLIVSPTSLLANNQPQNFNIVGDQAAEIKTIRLVDPSNNSEIQTVAVLPAMLSDQNRRLAVPVTLDPVALLATLKTKADDQLTLKIEAYDSTNHLVAGLDDVTIIVIQDRVIVEQVPYRLPPLVHDVIRPDLSIGVSVQENSSSVPLVLGLNPGLIGKTAPIKSQYFELAAKGDCSLFSGEVVDGCQGQGYFNFSRWGIKAEASGRLKYATSGSIYNLPYYYERSSFMTDGRFSFSVIPGRALTVRGNGEWSYVRAGNQQTDSRFRLSSDGFITFGAGRSVYVPEKLNLHFGLVPAGERKVAGEGRQLRGGGLGFDARWDRGILTGLPLGLYFGWERISAVEEKNPHNFYGGVNFDLMRFIDRTVGYQDFSKYLVNRGD
ncbi:MAG: hypothetical protein WCW67_07345 [Candidatus Margulisiibacteriota bacterium]